VSFKCFQEATIVKLAESRFFIFFLIENLETLLRRGKE